MQKKSAIWYILKFFDVNIILYSETHLFLRSIKIIILKNGEGSYKELTKKGTSIKYQIERNYLIPKFQNLLEHQNQLFDIIEICKISKKLKEFLNYHTVYWNL